MHRRSFLVGLTAAGFVGAAQAAPEPVVTTVSDNGLAGKLYALPGAKKRPAVLMLGGSGGGYPYDNAAKAMAQAGYPVLALAYFKGFMPGAPDGLPQNLRDIPLEYFFKAIDWMKARLEINPRKIVLMGESRGGELVLQLASLRSDVAGVIAYVPSHLRWGAVGGEGAGWTLNGQPLPFAKDKWAPDKPLVQAFIEVLDEGGPTVEAAAIPVEKIRARVLLFSTTADGIWPSTRMSDAAIARMNAGGKRGGRDHVRYDNASHLLMGPGPGILRMGSGQYAIEFGGTEEGTRTARDDAWAKSIAFMGKV